MIRNGFLILVLIGAPFFAIAQEIDLSVFGAAGQALVSGKLYDHKGGPTFNAGFSIAKHIDEKWMIGGGIGVSYFSLKEHVYEELIFGTDIINQMNGMPTTSYLKITYDSRLYFANLPLFIKYPVGKLRIKGGVRVLIFSVGSSDVNSELSESGNIRFSEYNEEISKKLVETNVGPEIGVEIPISKSLFLTGDIFYGLNEIEVGAFASQKKFGQAVIGLNYYLTKSSVN